MNNEYQIRVQPHVAANEQLLREFLAEEYGFDVRTITALRILRRSIDARQRTIFVNLKVRVYINEQPADDEYQHTEYPDVSDRPQVIVVGAGPGGLFAALRLIELGLRPIVLERGKDVHERKKDLALIAKTQQVDAESNYCFGEGGAGAYSDGKLYTRSKKRGSIEKILNVFCQHGASTNILADAHPHIGTDKLPRVIENMRNTILRCGGEVHFQTKMTQLLIEGNTVIGVEAENNSQFSILNSQFPGPVILATGHSARDVYRYLADSHIELEAKGIAVGVRLEHPSMLIDQIQYHNRQGRGRYLPAAEYSFVTQVDGRGVYSFCMCPGGSVVNASSEKGRLVINGMSNSKRDGRNANAGLVVQVTEADFPGDDVLSGVCFQEKLEEKAYQALQGKIPVQLLKDFYLDRLSEGFGEVLPDMKGSYGFARLSGILPAPVTEALMDGIRAFGRKIKGFDREDAVLSAIEARTSSPVRILRNEDHESSIRGIYPAGEGAGYAGGIVSAAIDGVRTAKALVEQLNREETWDCSGN